MRHDNQLFFVCVLLHQSSRVKYHELDRVHDIPQTMGDGDESDIPELATELAVSIHGH